MFIFKFAHRGRGQAEQKEGGGETEMGWRAHTNTYRGDGASPERREVRIVQVRVGDIAQEHEHLLCRMRSNGRGQGASSKGAKAKPTQHNTAAPSG